jgi:hypothetical protein
MPFYQKSLLIDKVNKNRHIIIVVKERRHKSDLFSSIDHYYGKYSPWYFIQNY